jgi:hypothetical protein
MATLDSALVCVCRQQPDQWVDPTGHVAIRCPKVCLDSDPTRSGPSVPATVPAPVSAPTLDTPMDPTVVEAKWIDLGQGWKGRIDPPSPANPNGKRHLHVYGPNGEEVGVWNDDGTISHKGRTKDAVLRRSKSESRMQQV